MKFNRNEYEKISKESNRYRNRVQLFNDHSPGNLSLLISHLTEEDGGLYQCAVNGAHKTIRLTIEVCTLENRERLLTTTAPTGGSVLLPCSCTDLQTKPEELSWKRPKGNKWVEISSESGQYRNRVQLVNDHSPGNLSLLISHLTEEDGGDYQCAVKDSYTFIRLTIEEPPQSLPFVPFALVTWILLHIIVAVVFYTSRTKGPARVHYSTADGDGVAALWRTVNNNYNTTNHCPSQHIEEVQYRLPLYKGVCVVRAYIADTPGQRKMKKDELKTQ
ncbi:hypothetical protein NFI96_008735, partial [Prochilodus magdalenae]